MDFASLSDEQQQFCQTAIDGYNIRVEACIGSGKTTAIQTLCNLLPKNKLILYLTYNKLLKADAKTKIKNGNVTVTNYHGFVYPYLVRNGIRCGISDSIRTFTENRLSIPRYDVLIIDEYQDIELDFAEMLEYIKSTNPNMQIIMVGDMSQKIYDKTTLDVNQWAPGFLGTHIDLEFTQCFRLQADLAAKLGRIWNKHIIGVNNNCEVTQMNKSEIIKFLSRQNPGDILCLGAKTGPMTDVLNKLEENYPDKFNKNSVYASIKNSDATIEPNEHTAIFTTFDSSKGMEKPICVIFDWDETYWAVRNRQPDTNYEILRNIFCVAASRGKEKIIFATNVKYGKPNILLSEETLMTPTHPQPVKEVYINEMFEYKFVEEIEKAYRMLDIIRIDSDRSEIDIADSDGFIDLSPCIREYQKMMYFKNYSVDNSLAAMLEQRDMKRVDLSQLTPEQKLLFLVSLATRQNRYCNQVRMPFVNINEHNRLITRLSERLTCDETTQISKTIYIGKIAVHDCCDIIKDDTVWQLEFKHSLNTQDYLKAAMHAIIYNKKYCVLWNTRTNELYKISAAGDRIEEFLNQVYRIITKTKSSDTVLPHMTAQVTSPPKKNTQKYKINDKVNHKKYGRGVVTDVKIQNNQQVLTIQFDNTIRHILSDWIT